jgi:protocatechuate 3,4-dioxygenase beta subunit
VSKSDRPGAARTRRQLIGAGLALPFVGWRGAAAQSLRPTPACGDAAGSARETPRQTAGPYYTPNAPQRAALADPGEPGMRLTLSGRVLTTACRPIPKALLDVWHCDAAGNYDNAGFRHRGHLFADASGGYRLETIVPGLYPGRTRHIHIRVQAPGGRPLTTQLYFPREPANANDGLWQRDLEIALMPRAGDPAQAGRFDFVLDG